MRYNWSLAKKAAALALIFSGAASLYAQTKPEKTTILVAAAASLKNAYEKELIPLFQKRNPHIVVQGTYDSSGKLQTQIENGLEADVFMSAASKQMNDLVKGGYIERAKVVPLLNNNLVLIKPAKGKTRIQDFEHVAQAASIALGDPRSVPAGQYAEEAFRKLGVWDSIPADKLSLGTNVTEVLNWVAQGNAEVGVVYATDAVSKPKEIKVICELPGGILSSPVLYPVAPTAKSAHSAEAAAFVDFLITPEAGAIFKKYGFTLFQYR